MKIKRVLLIDDDSTIRKVAQIVLADVGGWEVIMAEDGLQGIKLAQTEFPDLILLDGMMPGMDGCQTLAIIRGIPQLANIPVIFFTGNNKTGEAEMYRTLGVKGVITKPFDPLSLPDKILAIMSEPN